MIIGFFLTLCSLLFHARSLTDVNFLRCFIIIPMRNIISRVCERKFAAQSTTRSYLSETKLSRSKNLREKNKRVSTLGIQMLGLLVNKELTHLSIISMPLSSPLPIPSLNYRRTISYSRVVIKKKNQQTRNQNFNHQLSN